MGRSTTQYVAILISTLALCFLPAHGQKSGASAAITSNAGLHPNLTGQVGGPLRYRPENGDFMIVNGTEYFNRSLYGGNTAFRVDGGDKPEFTMYLPGRGGNLRLGVKTANTVKWLKDADHIVTRYRPGELIYEVQDQAFGARALVTVELLAYANSEGLIVRAQAKNMSGDAELIWAYGGENGQRGTRDGDIGTEKVPISQYFQFQPAFAEDNSFRLGTGGFTLKSQHATIVGVTPTGAREHVADADQWNDLPALLSDVPTAPKRPVVVGLAPFSAERPLLLSLQRINDESRATTDLNIYQEVATRKGGNAPQSKPGSFVAGL